jgi:hypothetical protein
VSTSCPSCLYFQAAIRPQLFRVSAHASPGELAAAKSFEDLQRERAVNEQRLVEQGEAFFVEPQNFNWCARYTLTEEQAVSIASALNEGEVSVETEWRSKGFDFAFDFANGDVRRAFALCARLNADGGCKGYKRRGSR